MKLIFYGGVREVTGANYLLESGGEKILIDCGLRQGTRLCEKKNWEPFSYNPREIGAVFITHSHIDHIGLLPKLYKDGFRGRVFSTSPCRDFSELLLYDSQHVLSLEAKEAKRQVLYGEGDIKGLMKLWEGVNYHKNISIGGLKVVFYNAGHILGSSFILVEENSKRIVFSGDLGNSPAPIIGGKDSLPRADYCLVESVYGDRVHENLEGSRVVIEDMIEDVAKSKGVLMIPAFAMERTQQILFEISQLTKEGRVPQIPVFIDSPLAIRLTEVYKKYRSYFSKKIIGSVKPNMALLDFPGLKKTLTTEESKSINNFPSPKVIIAGSGMMHAGRIQHHLKRYLPDPNSLLFIVGYQAEGSLGRRIFDGAKKVKIHGEMVPVRCRIRAIGGYSAHADQPQLLQWLKLQRGVLKKVFVVQGEESASTALVSKIRDELAIEAEIPVLKKKYNLYN